ncbi:PH domain-containing protein [Georgenia sp. TF02-10]|uniref:PH domain-containing protein n=1 Tax=Georgenia sp. TF02-10 TaxID=2917725 RepID=UPI001FA7FED2|nr:PH domain-containing protein [Georgenia sp. TF02-10]UNX54481.1 PH domain-containing protein [Georgenia sp. TF02-10]
MTTTPAGPAGTGTRPPVASPFDLPGVTFTPVSTGLVTARLVAMALWMVLPLAGGIVLGVLVGGWTWLVTAAVVVDLAWSAWLIPRQVRAIGYAEAEDDLLIRKGILFRSLTVVPYGRMQFVDVAAGPLDRRCGVATVQLHTASASTDAKVPGLPPADAARLRDRLTARGEAKLAGL